MLDPEFERAIRERFSSARFAEWAGIELVSVDDGTSEVRLRLEPHHLNPGRIAHGGIVAAMLDSAIGLACRTRLGMGNAHVTLELKINYLAPAREGTTIIARGESVRNGERVSYGEATLTDETGRVLARGSATFLQVSTGLDGE